MPLIGDHHLSDVSASPSTDRQWVSSPLNYQTPDHDAWVRRSGSAALRWTRSAPQLSSASRRGDHYQPVPARAIWSPCTGATYRRPADRVALGPGAVITWPTAARGDPLSTTASWTCSRIHAGCGAASACGVARFSCRRDHFPVPGCWPSCRRGSPYQPSSPKAFAHHSNCPSHRRRSTSPAHLLNQQAYELVPHHHPGAIIAVTFKP